MIGKLRTNLTTSRQPAEMDSLLHSAYILLGVSTGNRQWDYKHRERAVGAKIKQPRLTIQAPNFDFHVVNLRERSDRKRRDNLSGIQRGYVAM